MNDFKNLKLEGQLYKYTNVMRGYQFRYFVVDSDNGKLDYFMTEDMKHQKPRCTIELHGAVISPSDEDSTTFMVYSSDNEMYKLRAQDAKERQHWVNVLRLVSQSCSEPQNERDTNPQTINTNGHSKSTNDIKNAANTTKNETLINRQLINEILLQVHTSQKLLEKNIINLSISNNDGLSRFDKDILTLKATSKACVGSLSDCCNILYANKSKRKNSFGFNSNENNLQKPFINRSSNSSPIDLDSSIKSAKSIENTQLLNSNNNNNCSSNTFLSHTVLNINHDDELTDEESQNNSENDNNQLFDEDNKSQILHVLSSLKLGMDLTKITLPTFILDKRSLLELFADCMTHPDIFIKINDEKTPEDRIIAVLDWYLTLFHQIRKGALYKKPYNPILGETFHCSWKIPNESLNEENSNDSNYNNKLLTYSAEQVSHHPPISAFYLECEELNMKLNACINTKSQFLGMSIGVSLVGNLALKLGKYDEEYIMTLPSCYARSILSNPWIELGDKVVITCPQTGYTSTIIFHVKPFYGDNSNQISAEIKNKNEEIICRVKGTWNGSLEYTFINDVKPKKIINTKTLKCYKKRVRPLKLQNTLESRRLWQNITNALNKSDIDAATNYKTNLELQQKSNENNVDYKAKYFIKNKDDEWQHQNWLI